MDLFPDDGSATMEENKDDNGAHSETSFEVDTDFEDDDPASPAVLAGLSPAPAAEDKPAHEESTTCRLCDCHGLHATSMIQAADDVPFRLEIEPAQGRIIGKVEPSITLPGPRYEKTNILLCAVSLGCFSRGNAEAQTSSVVPSFQGPELSG